VTATVRFPRSLYRSEAVDAAAQAYVALAAVEVALEGDEIVATIAPRGTAPADLVDAFCNHALFETVIRERAGQAA
jgi:hypothetical protein